MNIRITPIEGKYALEKEVGLDWVLIAVYPKFKQAQKQYRLYDPGCVSRADSWVSSMFREAYHGGTRKR